MDGWFWKHWAMNAATAHVDCHCLGHRLRQISPAGLCWTAPSYGSLAWESRLFCLSMPGGDSRLQASLLPVFMGHGKTPGEIHSDVVPHGLRSAGSAPFYPTSQSCFRIVWWIRSRTFSYSYRGGAGKSESMTSCPWARQNLLFFKWRGKKTIFPLIRATYFICWKIRK